MKRFIAVLLLMSVMLSVCGCMSISLTPVETAGDVELPEREMSVPDAPVGDSRADRYQRITLYYISSDRQQLAPLSRSVRLLSDESAAEKALERLLESTGTVSLLSVAPVGTKLQRLEISEHIATVSLSVDALALDAQSLCWMKTAVVNTLVGLEGIEKVNVLIDGKEESGTNLPTGTLGYSDATLAALWAQQQLDVSRFAANPSAAQISRSFTLYFGAGDGKRLLPQVRDIVLNSDNPVNCILDALRDGPEDDGTYRRRVLPEEAKLLTQPRIVNLEDGRRILLISFTGDIEEQLAREGISPWQMYEALTYTLCRAVPQIDGISVGIGGVPVMQADSGSGIEQFEGGIMAPANFDDALARMGVLYFADETGMLQSVRRAMNPKDAVSPRALISGLMDGPRPDDGEVLPVMPEDVNEADLIGVRVEERCALINLSSNFYRLCQGMTQQQERSLIYAMVNTLCELGDVDRVRFYISGESVETLAGWIYLKTELMPNPGLVRQ